MLRHIRQNQVRRNRRHLIQPRLAELALNIVFLGETEAAMGLDAGLGGGPGAVGGQHFRYVGFLASMLPGVEFANAFMHQQLGGAHVGVGFGDRELHPLVLPDRAAEHHAAVGIGGGFFDEPFGVTD